MKIVCLLLGLLLGLLVLVGQGWTGEPESRYRLEYNEITKDHTISVWYEKSFFREEGWYPCPACIPDKYRKLEYAGESGVTGFREVKSVPLTREEGLEILREWRKREVKEKAIKRAWRIVK